MPVRKDLENSTGRIKAGLMNVLANHLTIGFVNELSKVLRAKAFSALPIISRPT